MIQWSSDPGLTLNPNGQVQWYDPTASATQVPLLWQGVAWQGAHFDVRLMSTGPEEEDKKHLDFFMVDLRRSTGHRAAQSVSTRRSVRRFG